MQCSEESIHPKGVPHHQRGIIEDMSPLANWPLVGRPNLFAGRSPISSKPHHRFFGFNQEVPASQRVLLSTFFLTFFLFSSFDLRKKKEKRKEEKKEEGRYYYYHCHINLFPHRPTFGGRKKKRRKKGEEAKIPNKLYLSIHPSLPPSPSSPTITQQQRLLLLPPIVSVSLITYREKEKRKNEPELIRKGKERGKHGQHPRQSSGRNCPLARNSLTPNRVRPFWHKRRSHQRPLRPPNRRTRELCARPAGSART